MIERDLIERIAQKAHRAHPHLIKGIGDDCAVFSQVAGKDWLISTDMLVEGVHFETSWHQPHLLGRKSLAVNISDIAAMGGSPQFALLSVGVSASVDGKWLERFLDGVLSILDEYSCVLIGGDTVSAKQLTISVTVLGVATEGRSILRDGAAPGDSVYVSGNLGSAAAGLYVCQNSIAAETNAKGDHWQHLVNAHLDPTPRVPLAEKLLKSGMVTAMQDISDGIATDLSHICTASKVAAVIDEGRLPSHIELADLCSRFGLNQSEFQLKGGEDYELVFTVKGGAEESFSQYLLEMLQNYKAGEDFELPPVTRIGEICSGNGLNLRTIDGELIDIQYKGYEHTS